MIEARSSLLICPFKRKQHHKVLLLLFLVHFIQKKNVDSRLSVLELMWFVMHVITGHKNVN